MYPNEDHAIIFLHIPKTAGITIHRLIERQYDPSEMFTILRQEESIEDFKKLPPAQRSRIRMLKGHVLFGAHELMSRPARYFTVLRDPVDRVLSSYYYILGSPEIRLREKVARMSLTEFVTSGVLPMADNGQTRYLSGVGEAPPYGRCSPDLLELARRNLREHFDVVGCVERFEETLVFLRRAFGWKFAFYKSRNVTKQRPALEAVPPETLALIEHYNQLDLELYRQSAAEFDKAAQQQDAGFVREVARLRLRSQVYAACRSLLRPGKKAKP